MLIPLIFITAALSIFPFLLTHYIHIFKTHVSPFSQTFYRQCMKDKAAAATTPATTRASTAAINGTEANFNLTTPAPTSSLYVNSNVHAAPMQDFR